MATETGRMDECSRHIKDIEGSIRRAVGSGDRLVDWRIDRIFQQDIIDGLFGPFIKKKSPLSEIVKHFNDLGYNVLLVNGFYDKILRVEW